MIDDPQLPLAVVIDVDAALDRQRIGSGVDVSSYGPLLEIVCTESDASFRFERGTLTASPSQFFDISKQLSRKAHL